MVTLEYAQARMQARHGRRPDEATWRQLDAHASLADYLAALHGTPLGAQVSSLDATCGPHAIERALRRHWRVTCAEVARWLPAEWQPAAHWIAVLVDLPARAARARGETLPPALSEELDGMADALPETGRRSAAAAESIRDRSGWRTAWQARWPADDGQAVRLRELAALVESHLLATAAAPPGAAGTTWRALGHQARRRFRIWAGEPAAAFAYLLLEALDSARLRAGLVDRALQRRGRP